MADAVGDIEIRMQLADALGRLDSLEKQFKKTSKTSAKEIAKLNKRLETTAKRTKTAGNAMKRFGQIVGGIALGKLVKDVVDTARSFDSLERRLRPELFEFIQKAADELGFELIGVADAFQKFVVAGEEAGKDTELLKQTFLGVATSIKAVDGSSQDLRSALKAVNDIINKNTVTAEELSGQLGEKVPAAVVALERALGLASGELLSFVKQGKITVDQILPAIAVGFRDSFGEVALNNLKSANSEFARTTNALNRIKNEIGKGFLDEIVQGMQAARVAGDELTASAKDIGEGFGAVLRVGVRVVQLLGGALTAAVGGLAASFAAAAKIALTFGEAFLGLIPGMGRYAEKTGEITKKILEWEKVNADFIQNGIADFKAGIAGIGDTLSGLGNTIVETSGKVTGLKNTILEVPEATRGALTEVANQFAAIEVGKLSDSLDVLLRNIEKRVGGIKGQFKGLGDAVRQAGGAARGGLGGDDESAAQAIKRLTEEQSKLQKQTFLTIEEMQRLDEITLELSEANFKLASGADFFAQRQEAVNEQLAQSNKLQGAAVGLIDDTNSSIKVLRDNYGEAGKAAAKELARMVEGLELTAETGQLSAGALELFEFNTKKVVKVLKEVAIPTRDQNAAADELIEAYLELTKGGDDVAAAQEELGRTAKVADRGMEFLEAQVRKATRELNKFEESGQLNFATHRLLKRELDSAVKTLRFYRESLGPTAAELKALGKAAGNATEDIGVLGEVVTVHGEVLTVTNIIQKELNESVGAFPGVEVFSKSVEEVDKVNEGLEVMAEKLTKVRDLVQQVEVL